MSTVAISVSDMAVQREFGEQVTAVTGAASGIGRACAIRLATKGIRVVLADLDAAGLRETEQLIKAEGGTSIGLRVDVTDRADCVALVDAGLCRLGGLDGAVLCAGTAQHVPFLKLCRADWDAMLGVHLTGAFLCLQTIAASMVERRVAGSLVYIASSVTAGLGPPRQAHYVAAKAGALGLVRAAARELGPFGIRVNAVSPGFTRTPLNAGNFTDAELAERAASAPLGRVAEPQDVTGAVEFLLGPESSFMTGQTVHVNGGAYMP